MFHISFLVDDKYVTKVLRDVVGIAHDLKAVPVVNAEMTKNGIAAKTSGAGDELLFSELIKRRITEFTGSQAKEMVRELGKATASYSHYLSTLKKHGYIKDHGRVKGTNTNRYTVTKAGTDK